MNNLKKTLFAGAFPFWNKLTDDERDRLINESIEVVYNKGDSIHHSDMECKGIIVVLSGRLRIYMLSEEGREVTLFYIYAGDSCVLSASCLLETIEFEIIIEPVDDVRSIIIPTAVVHPIMENNLHMELYMYKKATERFSDVMWTIQQILFMGADKRVAIFLWDEMLRQKQQVLKITHDEIAKNIGSAREVVTKILKYFVRDGIIIMSRGKIKIVNKTKLQKLL